MNLVEAEAVGPVEGDAPSVTAPRPPHRRVSVSLLFTVTVLIGTVVAIYWVFPARDTALLTEALAHHADRDPVWDLTTPAAPELRAWLIGVAGTDPPLPPAGAVVLGARRIEVLHRPAALIAVSVAGEHLTYVVQRPHGPPPPPTTRTVGALLGVRYARGPYACAIVGPAASAAAWRAAWP